MQVLSLFSAVFVFLVFYICFLSLLAINNISCSLAAFVFIICYTSHSRFIGVGFSLIYLLAFVLFFSDCLLFLTFHYV